MAITPGVGLVIVAGTALVSAIGAQSLVPGAQILSGTLWLAGPSGFFIALAADGLARLASQERELSPEEYAYAGRVFQGSLPPRSDIRVTDATGVGGDHYTFPRSTGRSCSTWARTGRTRSTPFSTATGVQGSTSSTR